MKTIKNNIGRYKRRTVRNKNIKREINSGKIIFIWVTSKEANIELKCSISKLNLSER